MTIFSLPMKSIPACNCPSHLLKESAHTYTDAASAVNGKRFELAHFSLRPMDLSGLIDLPGLPRRATRNGFVLASCPDPRKYPSPND
jgi:hypothetical protein